MGASLDAYDYIAIAAIVIYSFFLIGGVWLCIKHGFKSPIWRYLVVLTLTRIIGSAFRLALIHDPSNSSLFIGYIVLSSLGLGPLILLVIGLLSRLFKSINSTRLVLQPRYQQLLEVLMLAAMVLLIVGGTKSQYEVIHAEAKITYSTVSKASAGLMAAIMLLILGETVMAFVNLECAEQSERCILYAVLACLPFVMVRLVYAQILILGDMSQSVGSYIGAGLAMEIAVMLICEVLGFKLDKAPAEKKAAKDIEMTPHGSNTTIASEGNNNMH